MRKFMRTRAPPAPRPPNGHAPKTNGHANGSACAARRDDQHSTLSRYWSGSESSRGAGGGAGGGALFEDASFPADARALGDKRLARDVVWLRPHELCARPRFRGDDDAEGAALDDTDEQLAARWSVEVGEAGDAHVCCAAAALALAPRLLDRAAPRHACAEPRAGAYRFRFWVFGTWREVVVDDRLPTRGGRLLASRGSLPDDFTLPLLEKAYAKLYGSYAALRGGSVARALQDLSGGIVQSFSLRQQPRALTYQVLNSAVPRSTLLLATAAEPRCGLRAGQPYAVTGLARVRGAGGAGGGAGQGALVRLRAVSGRGAWAGAWAPHSEQWRALAPQDRELLAERAGRPGDFWMSFGDFAGAFARLELVHVGPDDWLREPALHARRPWRAVLARRRWRTGYNAGGPPSATETTGTNPQFHVAIPRGEGARKCHVVVSVTQQYAPGAGAKLRAIGFAVYELPPGAPTRRVPDHTALHGLVSAAGRDARVARARGGDVLHAAGGALPGGPAHAARAHRRRLPAAHPHRRADRRVGAQRRQPHRARRGRRAAGRAAGRARRRARRRAPPARRRRAGRGRAEARPAPRVARLPEPGAQPGAVPRAAGAARRGRVGRGARARAAGAAGAARLLARRLPAPRRAPLRAAAGLRLPPARAAVGGRRHRQQQGAGVPRAALRAPRRAQRGGLRHGAGAPAPRARALPQPRRQGQVQPAVAGGDDPDDDLLVTSAAAPPAGVLVLLSVIVILCYHCTILYYVYLLQLLIILLEIIYYLLGMYFYPNYKIVIQSNRNLKEKIFIS